MQVEAPVQVESESGESAVDDIPIKDRSDGGHDGLESLAPPVASDEDPGAGIRRVPLDRVQPNPFQPRREMDPEALESLASSIRQSGVIQPILVRPLPRGGGSVAGSDAYQLIAGERRWRAAQAAGLDAIPAIVRDLDDESAAELALVENIQREDLNAIERAGALRVLVERFGLTQTQVGERVGLNRSSVANLMRLGELEDEIQALIAQDRIGAGHGKALLAIPAGTRRIELAHRAAEHRWTVRALERAVTNAQRHGPDERSPGENAAAGAVGESGDDDRSASLADLERQLGEHLGTKVRIKTDGSGQKGRMVVEFYGLEHFDGLMEKIGFRAG